MAQEPAATAAATAGEATEIPPLEQPTPPPEEPAAEPAAAAAQPPTSTQPPATAPTPEQASGSAAPKVEETKPPEASQPPQPQAAAEKPRKRKSRWGNKSENAAAAGGAAASTEAATHTAANDTAAGEKKKKQRRSRWGSSEKKVQLPPQVTALAASQNLTAAQTKMMLLKLQLQEVSQKLMNPSAYVDKEQMSPSPEPVYDQNGKRTNTRDIRFQKKIMADRQKILNEMVKIDPSMAHLVPKSNEWVKLKVMIPIDKYPDYNFIGLIIGPRGNTQKRLQKETGAKIFVRGKEPGNRKMNRPHRPEDDEPLHVLITAREQESVDKAEKLIRKLLVPVADHENKHKHMQLQELAAMNGTRLDIVVCRFCGESGHKMFDCPKRQGGSGWVPANIRCSICGSDNHVDIDCPSKGDPRQAEKLDSEYSQFMAELGGSAPAPATGTGNGGKNADRPSQGAENNNLQRRPETSTHSGGSGSGGGGGFQRHDGGQKAQNDWVCKLCGNRNYSFRNRCNRCKADRKEADPNHDPNAPPPQQNNHNNGNNFGGG
eukprot:CAMPEP_0197522166 /NCGR_PEP_ID=MMETSP1318-20131121/7354_1 /TAXON_ID=552666 /ORGANISM="Partenskyella glossopodia, Strain RCC365" /LENGTH=544 /DNA_ID=CAMNT_0043074449 /DNA_START=97 /DNA_END=1727 /DNA_ORIENTATION=+